VLERAHVVEAVGELHQQHADVLGHVQQHLAKALGLAILFLRGEVELRELRDAVDEERISSPNSCFTSSRVAVVSSTVSCSSAAQSDAVSSLQLGDDFATAMGCVKYASPDFRFCPSCPCLLDERDVSVGVVGRDARDKSSKRFHEVVVERRPYSAQGVSVQPDARICPVDPARRRGDRVLSPRREERLP
jgi:hypothetical protein